MKSEFLLLPITLIFIFYNGLVQGFMLQLFESPNFEGLFYESVKSTVMCISLPPVTRDLTASLKTDQCIVAYANEWCQDEGPATRVKLPKGNYHTLARLPGGNQFMRKLKSFHVCKKTFFDAKTVVEVLAENFTLAVYQDLPKSCTNLPYFTLQHVIGINTYGSCIDLFKSVDCVGSRERIPGDRNPLPVNLFDLNVAGMVKSIMPCQDNQIPAGLKATIFKFEVTSSTLNPVPIHLEVTSNTFTNKGVETIFQDFVSSKSIQQVIKINKAPELANLGKIEISKNILIQIGTESFEIPHFAEIQSALAITLSDAYGLPKIANVSSSFEGLVYIREETQTFTFNNTVNLEPCTMQVIDSYVKTLKGFTLEYTAWSYVTSVEGQQSTAELTEQLDEVGLEVVNDHVDDFTVIVKASGTLTMDFGLGAVVNTVSRRMGRCENSGFAAAVNSTMMMMMTSPTTTEQPTTTSTSTLLPEHPYPQPGPDTGSEVNMHCGGQMTTATGEIHFHLNGTLRNARCVWVIRPDALEDFTSFKVDLWKMDFVPEKGQHEIILSGHARLENSLEIIPSDIGRHTIQGHLLIVTFYTGDTLGKQVSFHLRYAAAHDYQPFPVSPYSTDHRLILGGTQRFTYPMVTLPPTDYPNRDLTSILILPPNLRRLGSTYLVAVDANIEDICCDYIMVYIFSNYRWQNQTESEEGRRFSNGTRNFETTDLMLVTFHSDVIVTGGGFTLQFDLKGSKEIKPEKRFNSSPNKEIENILFDV